MLTPNVCGTLLTLVLSGVVELTANENTELLLLLLVLSIPDGFTPNVSGELLILLFAIPVSLLVSGIVFANSFSSLPVCSSFWLGDVRK